MNSSAVGSCTRGWLSASVSESVSLNMRLRRPAAVGQHGADLPAERLHRRRVHAWRGELEPEQLEERFDVLRGRTTAHVLAQVGDPHADLCDLAGELLLQVDDRELAHAAALDEAAWPARRPWPAESGSRLAPPGAKPETSTSSALKSVVLSSTRTPLRERPLGHVERVDAAARGDAPARWAPRPRARPRRASRSTPSRRPRRRAARSPAVPLRWGRAPRPCRRSTREWRGHCRRSTRVPTALTSSRVIEASAAGT